MAKKTIYKFNYKPAIIGLGYVGLPLLLESVKYFNTKGFDIDHIKISNLKKKNKNLKQHFTSNVKNLSDCNFFIVCVPTPIKNNHVPDLDFLKKACELVGSIMRSGSHIIFESTVYPGCTEEFCLPILEKKSKLRCNKDFYLGYSPERINPGDKKHNITNITKIVSSSNHYSANIINNYYKKIVKAGTYLCSSIKIAEAAKVIENTQRDLNIAFVNELSIMFKKMNLNTEEIINAASTKWNFLKFSPGLVGGHCIGVDPYYLTYKSKKMGFNPNFILSGRKINENMYKIVCKEILKISKIKEVSLIKAKVLILGLTFKDDCDDLRNSQILNIINFLKKHKSFVEVHDPLVDKSAIKKHKLNFVNKIKSNNQYDLVILARNHRVFTSFNIKKINSLRKNKSIFYDINNKFHSNKSDGHL
jgi:UDP-N-acetyl-D-glucosamine/UDP-N-acetyl-D-galactosamine dehydrogenase